MRPGWLRSDRFMQSSAVAIFGVSFLAVALTGCPGHVAPAPTPVPLEPATVAHRVDVSASAWTVLLARLEKLLPASVSPGDSRRRVAGYKTLDLQELKQVSKAIDQLAGLASLQVEPAITEETLAILVRMIAAQRKVDAWTANTLDDRRVLAQDPDDAAHRQTLRNYLATAWGLIDLSGRLHFHLTEALDSAAYKFAGAAGDRDRLIELVAHEKCSAGISVMSVALLDPPADSPNKAQPLHAAGKAKLIELIAGSGRLDIVPVLAEFVTSPEATPSQILAAAEAIRTLGLPQDPRPGQGPEIPAPPITAARLHQALAGISATALTPAEERQRQELLAWLKVRDEQGLTDTTYRLGKFEVAPGDWLLMHNPSPYNQLTDLAPGIYTHVGIVALERGTDDKQRMVVVELNERGARVPATNVDAYLPLTLHYTFLRHQDSEAAKIMGDTAARMIGQAAEFDLTFRTDRVAQYKGKLLGQKIKTYCAGLVLLCAQETDRPREEFFPLAENPPNERVVENLAKFGIDLGHDFISPTGPLFAEKFQIVGRNEALYDPSREIEEAVFDHFGHLVGEKELTPSPDLFQSLRQRMAEASKSNPLLAKALAAAADVNAEMDLVAGAKAAALIETLDEIAYKASSDFRDALSAMRGGSPEELKAQGFDAEQVKHLLDLRKSHVSIWEGLESGKMSQFAARSALLEHYIAAGKARLNARFFGK